MTTKIVVFVSMLAAVFVRESVEHGAIIEPPARNYMGMAGFTVPRNYDYNSLYCGGFNNQMTQGGKCGICGDPWQGPRLHEAGGPYATEIIGRCYSAGTKTITVKIIITAWHRGLRKSPTKEVLFYLKNKRAPKTPGCPKQYRYFIFKLCPNNNPKKTASQECFDQYPLQLVNGGNKYDITNNAASTHNVQLNLPQGLTCTQCILQWTYVAGNNWGCDGNNCGLGLGPQEHFVNCADIAILSKCTNVPKTNTSQPSPIPTTDTKTTTTRRTTPSRRTTTSSVSAGGKSCYAIGEWAQKPGMNKWCEDNCLAASIFCPAEYCMCGRSPTNPSGGSSGGKTCKAVGPWTGQSNMNTWCMNNCNAPSPFCPASHCTC